MKRFFYEQIRVWLQCMIQYFPCLYYVLNIYYFSLMSKSGFIINAKQQNKNVIDYCGSSKFIKFPKRVVP